MVAYADVVTQREVLAGLLQEPRIRTGILTTGGTVARPYGFKTRARRGRIVAAGSPYHSVRKPTGTFLGVIKVAPADRVGVAPVAQRLAELVDPPAAEWREELDYKAGHWRRMLALFSIPREPRRAVAAARGARRRPAHARGRRRARAPARDRARRRDRAAAGRARALERAHHRLAPALAVLGPPRLAGRAPARRGRHPRARRGPRAAQLGGQGLRRLLHHVLRLDLLALHRALGGAARADAQPGDAVLDRARRRRRRLLRGRRALEPWSWARCSSTSRSCSTASTASSPATRASSPSSAPGSTRSSTARRSTSCSRAWRSARAAPATRRGCWPARRWRCRPRATRSTSRIPSPSTR